MVYKTVLYTKKTQIRLSLLQIQVQSPDINYYGIQNKQARTNAAYLVTFPVTVINN